MFVQAFGANQLNDSEFTHARLEGGGGKVIVEDFDGDVECDLHGRRNLRILAAIVKEARIAASGGRYFSMAIAAGCGKVLARHDPSGGAVDGFQL